MVNVLTSLVGNVFGFKAMRALRLEDVRFPLAYVMTCGGPPHGIEVERDIMNKYGRPLLGCTIKPKLGLSAKNYGRAVYECLRGGLDFTKDDENVNSQPFMRWRDRFDFVVEAVQKAEPETGERKGHYLNVTAPTARRCTSAPSTPRRSARRSSCTTSSPAGFAMHQSLGNWCRNNGMLLHVHRAMHAVLDRRRPRHPLPRAGQVPAAVRRRPPAFGHGGGQARGRPRGDAGLDRPDARGLHPRRSRTRHLLRSGLGLAGRRHAGRLGRHPRASHAGTGGHLRRRLGAAVRWRHARASMGRRAGASANRVALEACVKARNEGRDLHEEGASILAQAASSSPEPRDRHGDLEIGHLRVRQRGHARPQPCRLGRSATCRR